MWYGTYLSILMQIMFKSIALQLQANGQLAESFSRKKRLQDRSNDIRHLIYALSISAKQRSRNAPLAARDMIRSVATFVCQLFTILDRGLVS